MDEKRNFERKKADEIVQVKTNEGTIISCKLVDISRSGAKLSCDQPDLIPDQFLLIIRPDLQRHCEAVVRSGNYIGIVFVARAG